MKIVVSDNWLHTCGRSELSGAELDVVRVRDFGPGRGKFYTVRLPGRMTTWDVWEIRGVTEIV